MSEATDRDPFDDMLVHDAYLICVASFESCKLCPRLPPASQRLVDDERGRFIIWAANTGASLKPSTSSSLDHRIRNSKGTRELVVLLLRTIRVHLDFATRIFEQPQDVLDEIEALGTKDNFNVQVSDSTTTNTHDAAVTLSSEALHSVHGLVSQLKKVSAAIRRATKEEYSVEAAKRRDTKNGIDGGAADEQHARAIVEHRFRDCPKPLQEALSAAISFRRRRFRDWERHYARKVQKAAGTVTARSGKKLGESSKEGKRPESAMEPKARGNKGGEGSQNRPTPATDTKPGPSLNPSKASFKSAEFRPPESISNSTDVSQSVRSRVGAFYLDWPRRPRPCEGVTRCPYCFEVLDESEARSNTKWRKHVKKDLEPYNCFHPECQKVLRLFPNERQWISHTKTSHSSGSWVCRMPPHATGMKLDTKDAFERHMEIDHAGMYLVSELETLAKGAYLPAPTHQLFPECPMRCLTNDIPQLDELQDSKSLIPHIANHLLLLAVEALPERSVRSSEEFSSEQDEDEGNELDIKKGTSPRKIRTTIRDALESLPTVGSLSYDDWSASSDGGRLSEWGHFACVRQQHSVVDVVDQLQDPAMKSFFMEQHRLSDVSLLRTQILRARRRWRIALTAALFISVLSHKLGKTPRYPSRKGKGKARPLDNQNIEKKVRLWPRILRRSFPKGEVASNDRDFQPLAERLYEKEFEYESTFPPEASGDRLYWPEDVIETLVNEEQVRWELGQAKKRFKEELVQFILEDARKLFAIAAVVESNRDWLLQAMEFFRKHDRFRDKNLSAEVGEPPRCLVTDELIRMDSELWKRDKARKICEQQWVALAPVLSTEKANYDFDHRARLPFKTVSHVAMGGTFSIVHKVEIHRDHLKDPSNHFNSQWPTFFAVKEIKAPDLNERRRMISDWAKEAQTLKIINEQHRDHILRFVTAFTRPNVGSEKSCYLIFEWADGGSLGSLFEQNPNPKLTPKLVQQASTQLLGLARALEVTHELAQIRHGDIKPDNILRFEPSAANIIGTLKIGDWGLAKFHKEPTVLRLQKGQQTETRYGTVMYEPPEVELGELRLLSRQYDIWSMGCVVLEIIIWLVYGYRSVQRFRWDVQGRYRVSVPCYVIESSPDGQASKAKLQPIVERWLGYLAADPVCAEDTALGELIKLVRTRLLIVELPPFMGETVRIKEWEVEDVSGESGRRLAISPQTARGGNLEPANPGLGRHRATSTDLVTALEQIMGDEDRAGDYWLADEPVRQPAPDFDLTDNPLNANPRVFGDA